MKKLLISAALLIITLKSCSSDENEPNTGGLTNAKATTNMYVFAYDRTNDGIENFVNEGQNYNKVYIFEYKGAEKKVTISTFVNSVPTVSNTYNVTSEKDGNLNATNGTNTCVFRFVGLQEVHQILKITTGEQRIKYYFK
jgi:hypothetical protein